MSKSKVHYRVWKKSGEVIALFPNVPGQGTLRCKAYDETQGLGSAAFYTVMENTRPATKKERARLAKKVRVY